MDCIKKDYGDKGAILKTEFSINIQINIEYEKVKDNILFIFNYNNDPSFVNILKRYHNRRIIKRKTYDSLNIEEIGKRF